MILSGLVAVMVLAVVWPAVALRPVRIAVEARRDAIVGRPFEMRVRVSGGRHGVTVEIVDPPSEVVSATPPTDGAVTVVPLRRGVVDAVEVVVRSGAPLGLVWWRRRMTVPLPAPVEVGPDPIPTAFPATVPAGTTGEAQPRGRSGVDTVRGVRDYVVGDPIRLVHWAATARFGDLMVKELEGPDSPRLAIVVDLRGPEHDAEIAAARAAGLARAGILSGVPVVLLTAEQAGPRVAAVASLVDVSRRLARAVGGPPPEGPVADGMTVVRVSHSGITW